MFSIFCNDIGPDTDNYVHFMADIQILNNKIKFKSIL